MKLRLRVPVHDACDRCARHSSQRTHRLEAIPATGAPSGATDVVQPRAFLVVLPDGRKRDVSYAGRRVAVAFQDGPTSGELLPDAYQPHR